MNKPRWLLFLRKIQDPNREASTCPSQEAGFSLLQIMVALAILVIISAMTWSFFAQTSRAKKNGERNVEVHQSARNTFNQLVKDLSMVYLSTNRAPGQELTPRTFFEGFRKSDVDELRFTYMGHSFEQDQDAKEGDTAAVAYFARPNPDPKKKGRLQLVRYESKQIQPVAPAGVENTLPGVTDVLCDEIARFEIWYYAPETKKWMESWSSIQANSFPDQVPSRVRINLVLYNDEGKEVPFLLETRINLFQILDTSPK